MNLILRSPLLRLLIGANLAAVIVWVSSSYWPMPSASLGPDKDQRQEAAGSLRDQAAPDLTDVLARPIFHGTRRPAVAAVSMPAPEPVKQKLTPHFELSGIIKSRDGGFVAYLRDTRTDETHSVRNGDTVGVWTIGAIDMNTVQLSAEGDTHALDINERD